MATLTEVKARQPEWFSKSNKKFFNDVSYKVLHGKASGKPYLVRSTYAWTDMFGANKTLHYRINPLKADLKIDNMLDTIFKTRMDVDDWLRHN